MEKSVKQFKHHCLVVEDNNFSVDRFFSWMTVKYDESGGDEYPEHAALGVLILWTTW